MSPIELSWTAKNCSPLVYSAIRKAHSKIGCGLGVQAYVNNCQLIGISTPCIGKLVEQLRYSCPGCFQVNIFFKSKSPFTKAQIKSRGPDDLLYATMQQDPLSHFIVDQIGPLFYPNTDPTSRQKYLSAYILLAV